MDALVLSGKKNALIPSSSEEEDLMIRNSKKVKNGKQDESGNVLKDPWPSLGQQPEILKAKGMTFADKLKGTCAGEEGSDDEMEKEEVVATDDDFSDDSSGEKEHDDKDAQCEILEDPDRNFPTFNFSTRMRSRLYKAWSNAVIVKLLDKNIGFKALEVRLQSMWAKRGVISMINIGYGFFVVKLSNREDYLKALTGGPWMIYDHYLTVQPWVPKFRPDRATIDRVAVWVRVPTVSLEYYDEKALAIIGNRIGKTIKVDMNTSNQLRGHFARICVLVDLDKQLLPGFKLDGEEYHLEYEGLHLLCTGCGVYGHRSETCLKSRRGNEPDGMNNQGKEMDKQGEEELRIYDERWTVVQKQRRQRRTKDKHEEDVKLAKQGSRFNILGNHQDDLEPNDNQVGNEGRRQGVEDVNIGTSYAEGKKKWKECSDKLQANNGFRTNAVDSSVIRVDVQQESGKSVSTVRKGG